MNYIGSKNGHYYFRDKDSNIYEISTLSEKVHFCCNNNNDTHDFEDEMYSIKNEVDTIDKFDLVLLRVHYINKNEKVRFRYVGTMHGNKYFLDNFYNVYGYSKTKPNEVHFCGLRRNKDTKVDDLKERGLVEFKSKMPSVTSLDLKNAEEVRSPRKPTKAKAPRQPKTARNSKKG